MVTKGQAAQLWGREAPGARYYWDRIEVNPDPGHEPLGFDRAFNEWWRYFGTSAEAQAWLQARLPKPQDDQPPPETGGQQPPAGQDPLGFLKQPLNIGGVQVPTWAAIVGGFVVLKATRVIR